jgi:hypothetical protein
MPGPEVIVPLVIFMIPIIAILTRHQQKMAELIHGGQRENQQITQIMHELYELKQLVHQQTMQIDDIKALSAGTPPKN